ncbi:acyl carrier protein [Actinospica durhamensis]|uniref:Acyl carrier protein n=1 Tax=Actinospica durhamensis TaxID=1508375 RepID=A0A941EQJ0_9ACTN|nr:acyl carrier protein [Actinospica durhamensis]MBR7835531.1 acyl carrier protein [Actinospica durhamensis]
MSPDPQHTALEDELLAWIADWTEGEGGGAPGPETDLMAGGLLDSMGLVAMIAFLEERTGVKFDFESFDPTAHVTVRALVATFTERQAAG